MQTKTSSIVTSVLMALNLPASSTVHYWYINRWFLSGIVVLLLVAIIPIASRVYSKKIISKSNGLRRNYYTTLTIINLLLILAVVWMTFVIVHDRVLHDGC